MQNSTLKTTYWPELNALRGLAVLMVFLTHTNPVEFLDDTDTLLKVFRGIFSFGWLGVDIFFVLSGFLITSIIADNSSSRKFMTSFYARRALRIWPLYFVTIAVVLYLGLRWGYKLDSLLHAGLLTFTSNIIMTINRTWSYESGIINLNHFWSLAIEEQFYLIWPLAFLALKPEKMRNYLLRLIILSFCFRLYFTLRGHPLAPYVLTICRIDGLAWGAFLGLELRKDEAGAFSKKLFTPAWSIGCIFVAILCARLAGSTDTHFSNMLLLIPMATYASGLAIARIVTNTQSLYEKKFWAQDWLQFLGTYSFRIYVIHVPLMTYINESGINAWMQVEIGKIPCFFVYLIFCGVGTIILARFSYHFLELPFLNLKKYFPYSEVNGTVSDASNKLEPRDAA